MQGSVNMTGKTYGTMKWMEPSVENWSCPNNQLDNTLKHLAKVSLMTYLDLKYFDLLICFEPFPMYNRFLPHCSQTRNEYSPFCLKSYTAHKQ